MKTPLYPVQEGLDASFTSFAGWDIAASFKNEGTGGAVDLTFTGVFMVEGEEFLNNMATQDIQKIAEGEGMHTAFLDRLGKIMGLAVVFRSGDRFLVWCYPGCFEKMFIGLLKSSKLGNGKVHDPRLGVIGVLGVEPELHADGLAFRHPSMPLILVFAKDYAAVYRRLLEKYGPIGWERFDAERIKAGEFIYGIDVNETYVFPAGYMKPYVSLDKGCYLGQEMVARMKSYKGIPPKAPVVIRTSLMPGGDLIINGDNAGKITSSREGFGVATIKKEFLHYADKLKF